MRVAIIPHDFGRFVDVYILAEGQTTRLLYPTGADTWTQETVPEGAKPQRPSFTLDRDMLDAFKEALLGDAPRADEELVRRLGIEEHRVDKMLDHLLGLPTIVVEEERRVH